MIEEMAESDSAKDSSSTSTEESTDWNSRIEEISKQSSAMMIEDLRSFIQGENQLLTIAIANALKILSTDQPLATAQLTEIGNFMSQLNTYAAEITKSANAASNMFSSSTTITVPRKLSDDSTLNDSSDHADDKSSHSSKKTLFNRLIHGG
jgi:hypothetical protein